MVFDLGLTPLFRRDRLESELKLVEISYYATNRIFSFVLGDFWKKDYKDAGEFVSKPFTPIFELGRVPAVFRLSLDPNKESGLSIRI